MWDPQCYPILSQIVVLFEIKHTNRFKKGLLIYFQPPLHLCELGLVYSNPKKIKPPFAIILKSSFIFGGCYMAASGSHIWPGQPQWVQRSLQAVAKVSMAKAKASAVGLAMDYAALGWGQPERSTLLDEFWKSPPTMMSFVTKLFPSPIEKNRGTTSRSAGSDTQPSLKEVWGWIAGLTFFRHVVQWKGGGSKTEVAAQLLGILVAQVPGEIGESKVITLVPSGKCKDIPTVRSPQVSYFGRFEQQPDLVPSVKQASSRIPDVACISILCLFFPRSFSQCNLSRSQLWYRDDSRCTIWLFNIAMENSPFTDVLPIKNGDFPWLC